MNKRVFKQMSIVVIVISLAIVAVACVMPGAQTPPAAYQPRVLAAGDLAGLPGIIISQQNVGLWVNGLGKATATPDVVILSLGVESQEKNVAQAQKGAAEAMNKVMSALKNAGVADKDIQTSQFNVQQITRWDDKQNTQIVLGYRVSNTVITKIRNVDKAGSVIDSVAVAAGDLTRINSISFTVDDPTPYQKMAREKAVQAAMEKARQIAQVSGVKIGKTLYINEGASYTPVVRDNYMKYAGAEMAPPSPTPISAGELEFQVNVEIVYEIN
jgi:uncharacterized protein YggE